jgi:hypothetical protein
MFQSKLAARTLLLLALLLLALVAGRTEKAWGADLHYGPYMIPWDKDPSKMTIMVETGTSVSDDHADRQIHFTYDSSSPEPNWSWSHTDIDGQWVGDTRRLFRIDITNLNPGHYYQYTFSYKNWYERSLSTVDGGFQATRPKDYDNDSSEFLALGDNRGANNGDVALLLRWVLETAVNTYHFHPEFMVHSGDIVFNGGDLLNDAYDWDDEWGSFFGYDPWRWVLERYPLMAALGNHDFDVNDHGGQHSDWANMHNFHTYLPYPHALPGGVGDEYTNNVNGQVWFFTLDTFPMWNCYCGYNTGCDNLKPGSAQYQWLDQNLSAIENDPRQWKIVLMHAPLYSPGDCNLNKINPDLENLLEKHGVDLVLAGHEHYYSRKMVEIMDTLARNSNIVHLVLGGAGATLSDFSDTAGYDCALKIWHFANIRIEGDVLHGYIVYAGSSDKLPFNRGDIVDSFTIDRTPQALWAVYPSNNIRPAYSFNFTDASKGHRYQYLWDFGDGTPTTTEENPSHTYAKAGNYNVTLTIKSLWNTSSSSGTLPVPWPAGVKLPPHILQLLLLDC